MISRKSKVQGVPERCNAFTLIELMIVVGIMGIVLTMGVPIVYRVMHRPPLDQAIVDLVEVCSNARARAILQGREVDLVFYPRERRAAIGDGGGAKSSPAGGEASELLPAAASPPVSGSGKVVQLSERVHIEGLGINLLDYTDQETAKVRFHPNGTCDEMILVLRGDDGGQRGITLEITTGITSVYNENEIYKLRHDL